MYPQVKGRVRHKPIVLSTIDVKDNTFNLAIVEPKFKKQNQNKTIKPPILRLS